MKIIFPAAFRLPLSAFPHPHCHSIPRTRPALLPSALQPPPQGDAAHLAPPHTLIFSSKKIQKNAHFFFFFFFFVLGVLDFPEFLSLMALHTKPAAQMVADLTHAFRVRQLRHLFPAPDFGHFSRIFSHFSGRHAIRVICTINKVRTESTHVRPLEI